jgi:hypothetical protein
MKAEDPAALVPFAKMSEVQKEAALQALEAEIAKVGGSSTLVAKLAGLLRRAADNTYRLEVETPRLPGWPSSRFIGSGHVESWALDLITKPLTGGLTVDEAFFLATQTRTLSLGDAVALIVSADDPLAAMSKRREEVERRHAEGRRAGAELAAERAREAAVDAQWLQANAGRVRRWGELPDLFKSFAAAADESGDATLQAFVAAVIEFARTRNVQQVRPPEFLWPLSG